MRKIKVLMCGFSYKNGGIESFALNYAQKIDKKKIEIDFINVFPTCKEKEFYKQFLELGKVHDLSNYRNHPIKFYQELKKIQKQEKYDIFHYNMASSVYLAPLIAAKKCKIRKIIAHAHNDASDKGIVKDIIHKINKHFISSFADIFVGCSTSSVKWMFPKKIFTNKKYTIIENGIDVNKFFFNESIRKNFREKLKISENDVVFGHVGSFKRIKNHDLLINTFYEIQKQEKSSKLLLIGLGPLYEVIKEKVKILGIEDKVLFLGQVNDVHNYLNALDCFIFPSFHEGLGIALVEAQVSGLPCVISDTIPKEAIVSEHVECLSTTKPAKIWASAALKLINKNREIPKYYQKYDINVCVNRLENLYMNNAKYKIAHFVYGIMNGGVERVLINYFSNMDTSNYELHIVTQGESEEKCLKELEKLNFNIHTVTKKQQSLVKNMIEIIRILKNNDIDIIHCHMSNTNFFPLFYGWLSGIKIRISHSHNAMTSKKLFIKILCHLSKLFDTNRIACSKDAATWLFNTEKNVYIMKNAINLNDFQYNEEERKRLREEMDFNNCLVLGNVGRFSNQKNHEFLLEVFDNIYKENKQYHLVLIGVGELEEKIKTKVEKLNSKNNIHFLGARNDVNQLYQMMDIFLLPSFYEGLGIVLVEAQVSGLPCISSEFVPKEVKLSQDLVFLELNKEIWKKRIINTNLNNRTSRIKEAIECGYEIHNEALKLDMYYQKIIKERWD